MQSQNVAEGRLCIFVASISHFRTKQRNRRIVPIRICVSHLFLGISKDNRFSEENYIFLGTHISHWVINDITAGWQYKIHHHYFVTARFENRFVLVNQFGFRHRDNQVGIVSFHEARLSHRKSFATAASSHNNYVVVELRFFRIS